MKEKRNNKRTDIIRTLTSGTNGVPSGGSSGHHGFLGLSYNFFGAIAKTENTLPSASQSLANGTDSFTLSNQLSLLLPRMAVSRWSAAVLSVLTVSLSVGAAVLTVRSLLAITWRSLLLLRLL
jgi:hypothetical protein